MADRATANDALHRLLAREGTGISWAHLTFNPWIGCTKISPACDNCYAETLATNRLGIAWGPNAERRRTAPSTWAKPLRWNRIAAAAGVQLRVFCASLADVFDNQVPPAWREDLWRLIDATPNLTWMLLTKRPQNVVRMAPHRLDRGFASQPANIMLGITAEDQARLDQRYQALSDPFTLFDWPLFLSAEPLRGPLRLDRIGEYVDQIDGGHPGGDDRFDACLTWANGLTGELWGVDRYPDGREHHRPELGGRGEPKFAFVITGGESGKHARPSHPDWFRALRDQCASTGTPFHFKQWGECCPRRSDLIPVPSARIGWVARDGRFLFDCTEDDYEPMYADDDRFGPNYWSQTLRVGTKAAGRHLDGILHDAVPGEPSNG